MPKIECLDVYKFIHAKQQSVFAKWKELSEANLEPTRRQCLAMLYDGLQDVKDELPCKPTGNPIPSMHMDSCYHHCEIRAKGRAFLNLESTAWEHGCREGCEQFATIISPYWDQLREWAEH